MTTVAFDGKILAADRVATFGNLRLHGVDKVRRGVVAGMPGEYAVGVVGDSFFCSALLDAVLGDGEFPDMADFGYPPEAAGRPTAIIAKVGTSQCWLINSTGHWTQVKAPVALGAGAEFALGALAAGAGARRAVILAAKHTDCSGGGVSFQVVRR